MPTLTHLASTFFYLLLLLNITTSNPQVHMIIEVFRHGARNPLESLPTFSIDLTREDYQDLSTTGMRNHFNLGRLLHAKYPNLIQGPLSTRDFDVKVSATRRTVSSVYSQILGMEYGLLQEKVETPSQQDLWTPPQASSEILPKDDLSLPQGVHIFPLNVQGSFTNFIFFSDSTCPNIKDEFEQAYAQEQKKLENVFAKTYNVMEKNKYDPAVLFADKVWNVLNLFQLSDTFLSKAFNDKDFKFTWEEFLHMDVVHTIRESIHGKSKEVSQVSNAPMFNAWIQQIERMEHFLKHPKKQDRPPVVNLYSGHDMTLEKIINALFKPDNADCVIQQYRDHVQNAEVRSETEYHQVMEDISKSGCFVSVAFASSLILEFYTETETQSENMNSVLKGSDDELRIRFLYNGKEVYLKNKKDMSVSDFKKELKKNMTKDFNKDCGNQFLLKKNPQKSLKVLVLVFVLFILVVVLMYFGLSFCKKRRYSEVLSGQSPNEESLMSNGEDKNSQ